jgi:hypothetical protein
MTSQYAYQRAGSTEAALHNLVQKIEGSLNQKEFALGVCLDIDGAFDNASFGSMVVASIELFEPCVGGLMACFDLREVPSVVEHGGGWASPMMWFSCKKASS